MIKNYIKNIFRGNTLDERLIIGLAISLFLPFELTVLYVALLSIYILSKKDLKKIFGSTTKSNVLIIVALYMFVVSLVYQNWTGALVSIGLIFLFIVFFYYRSIINLKLFEQILDVMIFMSIISAAYGIIEQLYYYNHLESLVSFFDISNSPDYRVHAFYTNANYYAMMIIFVEIFCVHKLISQNKNKLYYNGVIILNLLALFLTGSRFAWFSLIIALIIMFIFSKKVIAFLSTLGISLVLIVLVFFNIPIIPRLLEYGISLDRREIIYETSMLMIKDTWLLGKGPFTYLNEWPNYLNEYIAKYGSAHLNDLGISGPHSHSIFFEPLISLGIIGSSLFIYFLFFQYKEIFWIYKNKLNRNLTTLIIAITTVAILADIIDLPILWIQTGLLFFIIIGGSGIYFKEYQERNDKNDRIS